MAFAEKSLSLVESIVDPDTKSYHRAKASVAVGKAYLSKKEKEIAERYFLNAQTEITAIFGVEHPLTAKFNQNLIEAYNLRQESAERTELINSICRKNVEILEQAYGSDHILLIRPLYTLYTATLHEESDASDNVLLKMTQLKVDGEPVKDNQFIFKAILIDTMLLMQTATQQAIMRVEMTLSTTFEKQVAYCEGEKNHPFLEEVVSIFASYFESTQSYSNAFLMWSKFLRIQQNMFGEDREQMISTYKKLGQLAVFSGQPEQAKRYYAEVNKLLEAYNAAHKDDPLTDEQRKTDLEE